MKNISFLFTGGRKRILGDIKNHTSPSEFCYGAPELASRGYGVEYLEYEDFNYKEAAPKFFFLKKKSLTQTLARPENLQKLNSADILIATTNGYGSALASLRKAGKITAQVMSFSMGMLEINASEARKQAVKEVMEQVITLITSNNETQYLHRQFPELKDKIFNIAFGADTSFWCPATGHPEPVEGSPYVLSIGNDKQRDFELLVKAWKASYPPLKIITKTRIETPLPANVTVVAGDWRKKFFSDEEIRTLMQEALFGILPIKQTYQPSGQSACLQIMACGKAVIISKMKGLWDEAGMRHGETCMLPEPGSIPELQDSIETLLADPAKTAAIAAAAAKVVSERFTTQIMADDLEQTIRRSS